MKFTEHVAEPVKLDNIEVHVDINVVQVTGDPEVGLAVTTRLEEALEDEIDAIADEQRGE